MTSDTPQARDWAAVRQAAIDALTAVTGDPQAAPGIADAVLAVCDEEAVNRMSSRLLDDTCIRAMDFRNGMCMELQPARELAALWVGAARGMLGDAANYVEMETHLAGDAERYVFRVERCGHLTPHLARIQAEQRAAEAERQAGELRAEVERLSRIAGQRGHAIPGDTQHGGAPSPSGTAAKPMSEPPGRQEGEARSPGTLVCDLSRPPGYDTAPPELRAAFDQAFQASDDARRAYAAAVRDAGGHRGRRVRALFAKYTATIEPLSNARAALTDPAAAAAAVVREAVKALLSIGTWGLHDSNRAEVWTLAIRARRALDGNPMSDEEAARFRASIPARYQPSPRTGQRPPSAEVIR